jgi:hypothetical protein
MNAPPEAKLRYFLVFLLRPIKKCYKSIGSGKARLRPELTIPSKRSQALSSDLFFYCSKHMISLRSLATLKIGKNYKQKFEHKTSQSPLTTPNVTIIPTFSLSR